jgi:beta-lactamase class A
MVATRPAPTRRPRARARASQHNPLRAWVTLIVLVIVVGAVSLGRPNPFDAFEAIRGLTYHRPPATANNLSTARPDPELQRRVEQAAVVSQGTLAWSVLDLQSGAAASLNADRRFPAASLFKLPILVEVLAQEQLRRLSPDQMLEITQEDWTDGSGVLQARVGDRLSVDELTRLMIQQSDNIAALVLLDAVGADNVNATLDRLGLKNTEIVDRRAGRSGEHTTSAGDMARLLHILSTGQLIDPDTSERALKLLELRQANTWLGESLPWWVKVAHKWGDLPNARSDAGIVYTPRGNYVTVVLTENASPEEAERAIAHVSQAVYDYLGTAPRSR